MIRNPYPILHIYELGNKFRAIGIPRETFRERFSTLGKGPDISAKTYTKHYITYSEFPRPPKPLTALAFPSWESSVVAPPYLIGLLSLFPSRHGWWSCNTNLGPQDVNSDRN